MKEDGTGNRRDRVSRHLHGNNDTLCNMAIRTALIIILTILIVSITGSLISMVPEESPVRIYQQQSLQQLINLE